MATDYYTDQPTTMRHGLSIHTKDTHKRLQIVERLCVKHYVVAKVSELEPNIEIAVRHE